MTEKIMRRPQFRTHIVSFQDAEHKLIYKCPATELAKEFVQSLPDKEKMNAGYVKDVFEVLNGTSDGNSVEYEYLPLPSVEEQMINALQAGDILEATNWLKDFASRLLSLELVENVPGEFLTLIVGPNVRWDKKVKCFKIGMIDLIPRNVLCQDARWIIIDNEWSFCFPVPVWFVIFRSIYSIAVPFQREIRRNASKRHPVRMFFRSCRKNYYIPREWHDLLQEADIPLTTAIHWERKFQQYVTGQNRNLGHQVPVKSKFRNTFVSSLLIPETVLKGQSLQKYRRRISDMLNALRLKF